jgi:hypothetical protein
VLCDASNYLHLDRIEPVFFLLLYDGFCNDAIQYSKFGKWGEFSSHNS